MPPHRPKFSRTARVLLGFLVVLAGVVALFDWNWFRYPLERHLADRSQREVRIGHLQVELASLLEPTVRLRDVYIANAPWADQRPLIVASEVSFTFSLKSAWEQRPVVSRLVLVDADVDLERQADGLRNWRLRTPEYRGPGVVKVLRLEPHRTKIRFVHRGIDLDVAAAASAAAASGRPHDASHPTRIQFQGTFAGTSFSGDVQTGELLTFIETEESFALRGSAWSGKNRLEADGSIADLFKPSVIDAKVRLAGPSLAGLHVFARVALPASRPYDFTSLLRLRQEEISFTQLRGKLGSSDLAGQFSVDWHGERKMLRAALRSGTADLSDFTSLSGEGASSDRPAGAGRRLFSDRAFDGARLSALDAQVTLDAGQLKADALPALESLRVTADLSKGILSLQPFDIGLAGGHAVGLLTFDARQKPTSVHAKLELKDMRLEKLFRKLPKGASSAGPLKGRVEMKGQGDSAARILAGASGYMEVAMDGGGISNLLDAKLALNGGKILRLLLSGDRIIEINSAAAAFDFEKGLGRAKTILLDTDQTRTEGAGSVDLREETVDLLLTPHPKKPGILTLDSSIRVHGPLRQPEFSLVGAKEGTAFPPPKPD